MEAIGAAATIVQLLAFTGEVLALGYGYLSKVKKAPTEIRGLLKETATLNGLLDQISELNDDQVVPGSNKAENSLATLARLGVLEDCARLIKAVEGMLKACVGIDGQGMKNAGKRLLWPFKEKDTNNLLNQLGRLRETLSAAIILDSARALKSVEDCSKRIDKNLIIAIENIATVQDDLSDIKFDTALTGERIAYLTAATENRVEQEEIIAIRKWLCPEVVDIDSKLTESNLQRHKETGRWFVEAVDAWVRDDQACIWFHGIAGSGKTILAAMAVEHLRSRELSNNAIVLHFFCDRRDPRKQSMQELLYAIISQVLDRHTDSILEIKRWRDDRLMTTGGSVAKPMTMIEYIILTQKLCLAWNRVILVVDAVDECSDVVAMTENLAHLTKSTNLRLLLTSRFDVEMQRALQPLVTCHIPVSGPMQDDIRKFLRFEIQRRIACGTLKFRTKGLDEKILVDLQNKSDGMILLAKLHLDYICALKSDRAIKEALIKLPSRIYPTYDEILDQMCLKSPENINELKMILQWLTYSFVPLSLQQLAEVVSIQEGDDSLDESGIVTDYMDLVALCGSLVTVVTNGVDSSVSFINLSHTSVEEYFKSGKMRPDLLDIFALDSATANLAISKTCLQYISFKDFEKPMEVEDSEGQPGKMSRRWFSADKLCLQLRSSQYALADYASRYWSDHLRLLKNTTPLDEELVNHLDWFLNSAEHEGKYRSWQQMYHRDIRYYCKDRPALHYAIEFKLDSLVSKLLPAKDKIDVLVGGKSALHVAARCGALTTIQELINLGADVNLASGSEEKGMTVLHFAAEGGHEEALKMLLKHGASVKSRSTSLSTPFYRAARSGSLEALQILYDAGSEINAKTWDHWTPLFESVTHGRRRVASQLLQWGADPSVRTLQGESTMLILQQKTNVKIREENPDLSGTELEAKLQAGAEILARIEAIKKLGTKKEIKDGFDTLVKDLPIHYLLVQSMDKDTRPGTEREKDRRFPDDPKFIITTAEYSEKYDDEPQKLSLRLRNWEQRSKSPAKQHQKVLTWSLKNGIFSS